MLPDLGEIPRLRRALGLSQTELASLTGVSQSAIAKIERGQTSPSYQIAKKILDRLDAERKRNEPGATVTDVRTRKVVSVGPAVPLETAVADMRRHKFSQLPVIDGGRSVGSLSERAITNLVMAGKTPADFARMRVSDAMEPPFPTIDEKAPVSLAAAILQHYGAVLTTSRGEVQGIVTKSDLLKLVQGPRP
ncbi:MAG: CBS domain-containing protein [Methanobacteriota archaeon]|nr:MAG: CBS domain-containing protein [Euryarchaeota archaeon]